MADRLFRNYLRTLGAPEDPVATNTSAAWSAMSLLKAVFDRANRLTDYSELTPASDVLPTDLFGVYDASAGEFRSTTPNMMGTPVSITQLGASTAASAATNFAALVLAISLASHVIIPPGDYDFGNNSIPVTNKAICIEGRGIGVSRLFWNGSSGGFTFTQNSDDYHVTLKGFSMLQEGAGVGTAVAYDGSGQKVTGVIQGRGKPRMTIRDMEMRGATSATVDGWSKHVVGVNAMRVVLDCAHVIGKYTAPATHDSLSAYEFSGDGQPTEVVLSKCWALRVQKVLVSAELEGLFADQCNFIAVDYGVDVNNTGAEPQLCVTNSHMAVYQFGIKCNNVSRNQLVNNLIIDRSDASGTVVLIQLGENCDFGDVTLNKLVKTSSATVVGIRVGTGGSTSQVNHLSLNLLDTLDIGIDLQSQASSTRLTRNVYSNCAVDVSDAGANTVRNDGQDGTAAAPIPIADSDTNTGFYRIANNRAGFAAGGSHIFEMAAEGLILAAALGFNTGKSSGNTALLQAYDVDDAVYRAFLTLTAGNTPACALGSTAFPVSGTFLNTGLKIVDTNASHALAIVPSSNLTADRNLSVATGDANRALDISAADVTVSAFGASLVDDNDGRAACATLGTWKVLAQSAVAVSHTGDTNETTLATVQLPANALGANGRIRITTVWSYTNSANNKIPRIRFGGAAGTVYYGPTFTTTATAKGLTEISNRNATNSQFGFAPTTGAGGLGGTGVANATSAVDTTAAVDIVFRALLANAGETLTLESYLVEIFSQA